MCIAGLALLIRKFMGGQAWLGQCRANGQIGRWADGLGLGRQKTRRNAVHIAASGLKGRRGRLFQAAACTLKGYGVGLA